MEIAEELEKYFGGLSLQITLYPEKTIKNFSTLQEFYEFIKNERDYWSSCNKGKTAQIANRFNNIFDYLNNAITGYKSDNVYSWQQNFDNSINIVNASGFPILYSITHYGQFIKERYSESYEQADAVIDYVQHTNFNNISSYEYFKGILYAFNWRESEIACSKFEETQESTFQELKSRYLEEMNILHGNYLNRSNEIKDTYTLFSKNIETWKEDTTKNTDFFLEEKKNKLIELEKIYEEKLKLKAPAEYWDKLREEYENKGNNWRKYIIGTSTVLILLLIAILYKLPESLKVDVNELKFENLRATLILTIIISIGVYILRLFVKLSLSAYHLSRDAKERYQLTYVYLSLLNEGNISESERNIVFQSLFSRADTGLLKGDSSPTLPDGMFKQIVKLMGK